MKMKPIPKLILFVAVVALLVYGIKQAIYLGYVPRPNALKTLVPIKADDIEVQAAATNLTSNVKALPLPSKNPSNQGSLVEARMQVMAWNAQMGLMYANGGPTTTQGSLMERQGVRLKIERQDDTGQMQNELVAFATALQKSSNPSTGHHFAIIMADGGAAFLQGVNPKLKKLGDEYQAEIAGIVGYSRGEDAFLGPSACKGDPQACRGLLVAGVLRDGDWNIAMRWAQINDIPNNPDEQTYDPTALNWVGTADYVEAGQKYIANFCPEMLVKGTRDRKKVCVGGVVTWFPVDEQVAMKRGGLVKLLSTKTAIYQMPAAIIGIRKWDQDNSDKVAGVLAAAGQGGDQIRASTEALKRAGEVSAEVYKEKDGNYWASYYGGLTKKDLQGIPIELGGSYAANLADEMQAFGLDGGPNIVKTTYSTWGNVTVQQYPNVMKAFPNPDDVINPRYTQIAANRGNVGEAESVSYEAGKPITEVVGHRNYRINFKTGSADILPNSHETLDEIASDLVTSNTQVILHGHTDNTGSANRNMGLSEDRANSVKAYLLAKGGKKVPADRIRVVGHGQEDPIDDNATEAGRANNRRVEIVLGR